VGNPFDDAPEDKAQFIRRALGEDRTGTVTLRDFDLGVVQTMGGVVDKGASGNVDYFLKLSDVDGPPGDPGVPIIFSHPEDVFAKKRFPCVIVQRDSLNPAMSRWQGPLQTQYRTAAVSASKFSVTAPDGTVLTGFTKAESLKQAIPYDIGYTISIYSTGRDAQDRLHASRIFSAISRIYQPYCLVIVNDSVQDVRSYQAYMEGIAPLDDVLNVSERIIGFALTLRVEGELDFDTPQETNTVTVPPKYSWSVKKT